MAAESSMCDQVVGIVMDPMECQYAGRSRKKNGARLTGKIVLIHLKESGKTVGTCKYYTGRVSVLPRDSSITLNLQATQQEHDGQ